MYRQCPHGHCLYAFSVKPETKQIAVLSLEKAAIALFLHIFARLPIFSGRHPDVFVKHGVEMANAAESQVIRDVSDGSGAVGQQALCFADAAFHDILHGRYALRAAGIGKSNIG